jgi:hypothetical protein
MPLARKRTGERVFRTLKPKLMRKRIPPVETAFGAGFLVLLVLVALWVLSRRDAFDPTERDISFETLQAASVEDTLYRRPLQRWVESGTAGGAVASPELGVFPDGLLAGGWELDGRVENYDPDNVYEKINGAAEQYLAFGFRALHYATLAREGSFLTVELYDQGEFRNALGIFAAQRDTSRRIREEGDVYYYPTAVGAVGGYANYYFKIAGDRASEAVTEKARQIVAMVSQLPAVGAAAPAPYAILTDDLGFDLGAIAYQRADVFQYDFLGDFWFADVGEGSDARYFIHEASDAEEARALFARLVEEQMYDYAVLERDDDGALLEHEYLKTVFAVRRRGRVIFGVEGAESRERALALIRPLDEVTELEEATRTAS